MTPSGPYILYSESFTNIFTLLKDPRRITKGNFKYPLTELLFLVITSVLCGHSDYECISDFGKLNLEWFRKYFPFEKGICSPDVLERLFQKINHQLFNKCFMTWAQKSYSLTDDELIAIDGKRVCGSYDTLSETAASHILTAFMSSKSICMGQVTTQEKSNEITAIPELLDSIDVKGAMISIDAMGCQKAIAKKIISKNANYLLAVKENQKELYQQIENLFTLKLGATSDESIDNGHGRVEKRTATLLTNLDLLEEKENWASLKSILKIDSERYVKSTKLTSYQTRYYICSSNTYSATKMNHYVREHWAIENKLHWQLDVNFGEDDARKRIGNSAKNFNLLLKTALTLLQRDKINKISIRRKKLKASYNLEYRELMMLV